MAIFKCKICGGDLEISSDSSVAVCQYCGTKQTLPHLSDERRANLYDRANHFRRNNDFDKAMGIYEQILSEDTTDAEAYWSIILCRYGIEYVKDGSSNRYLPTVNRMQYTSIYDDEDYKSAIQNADTVQHEIYEADAQDINNIQKEILSISQKEEPFDVFICYKETDANGRRTQDSVLATELYHELTKEGFKVFFSRITLEDKLGTAYEPYIFAALNSAKVMVALGTKPEHFNAVWVKNEWSRYLALIKNGAKKMLIPAYRDMDPYDLPDEFSHLQAQDMSKLGFMQDLTRGIIKILEADAPARVVKETVIQATPTTNIAPLLKRAFMFLEDGEWKKADDLCEQVLNQDPECAEAYLGKLMAELQVTNRKSLTDCPKPFDDSDNYSKVLRFGDEGLEAEMRGYIKHINARNEEERQKEIYYSAVKVLNSANSETALNYATEKFKSISGFMDSDILAEKCRTEAEKSRSERIYASAMTKMATGKITECEAAVKEFGSIPGWRNADEQIIVCQNKIADIKSKMEAERLEAQRKAEERRIADEKAAKKRKKAFAIGTPIVCACIAFVTLLNTVIIPTSNYNKAISLLNDGEIVAAYESLVALNGYKDSATKANEIFDQYKTEKNENCHCRRYRLFWFV